LTLEIIQTNDDIPMISPDTVVVEAGVVIEVVIATFDVATIINIILEVEVAAVAVAVKVRALLTIVISTVDERTMTNPTIIATNATVVAVATKALTATNRTDTKVTKPVNRPTDNVKTLLPSVQIAGRKSR